MTNLIQIINTICSGENSRSRPPLRCGVLLIALVLAWFMLGPQARAVCQDACLTGDNTVQGDDALVSNTTGTDNVALGHTALFSNTTGGNNTATGTLALFRNSTGNSNIAVGYQAGTFTSGNNNIDIGNRGVSGESNKIRIGAPG